MNEKKWKAVLTDWRVLTLIALIIISIVAIYPHFDSSGQLTTNIQYGLDFKGGSWIQMEFLAEVVGFTSDDAPAQFAANLSKSLDADVELIDANHLEIRKFYNQSDLEPVFVANGGKITSYQQGVSKETSETIKAVLENKINNMGTQDANVQILSTMSGIAQYARISLAGVDMNQAQEIVGKQGKFEIRIQTTGNESEHVIYGDAISSVQTPQKDIETSAWGVPFTLNEAGGKAFQEAAIKYGATTDPSNHKVTMILDNKTVFSAPLDSKLAGQLATTPERSMRATTGTGDAAFQQATQLEIHLRAGALPVDVHIVDKGQTPAAMAEQYMRACLIAGLIALVTVAFVIYYRYREPSIVLPMVLINASEILILLGFIALIKFQVDLPTIAGLIAVLGTGIDQLVIITDEILHEGKVPSSNLYLKRLARALTIIVMAAATVTIAMIPLALMPLATLRGFAIITIMGVLVGVIVTRPAYGRIVMDILSE